MSAPTPTDESHTDEPHTDEPQTKLGTTTQHCEVAILGGGIAGIMAATRLKGRDFVLLEGTDRLGGRVESLSRGDYWVNLGAQFTEGEGPLIGEMDRVDVPRGSLANKTSGLAWNGRVSPLQRPSDAVFRSALPLRARVDLAILGLSLLTRYHRATKFNTARSRKFRAWLDEQPSTVLATTIRTKEVQTIFRSLVRNWIGCEPEETAATQCLISLGSAFVKASKLPNFSLPMGGNQVIVDRLASELGDRARTGCEVRSVTWTDDLVTINHDGPDGPTVLTADRCIVALTADRALEVLRDLDGERRAALAAVKYGTFVVAGVFTSETEAQPWDDLYSVTTPGLSFEVVFNHATALRRPGERKPGGALVCYAAADKAHEIWDLPDAEITALFSRDLVSVFPGLDGKIDDVVIRRQPRSVPYWDVSDRASVRLLREPFGPMALAGDYLSAIPSMAAAAGTGDTASRHV